MNDLENELSRFLVDAAERAPRVPAGLSATVKARHRRRRARSAALLAAVAVVVVIGGAGVAVNAVRTSVAPQPVANATDKPTGRAKPPADVIPPSIEKVWPQAVHKIPATLPDGRDYYPELLLDDRTLLVITGITGGKRRFLWSYDLHSGKPTRIAEIPLTKGSQSFADDIAAGDGNIVWWAFKEAGKNQVAQIWTVPVRGGTPRPVSDVPMGNATKQLGQITDLTVVGKNVIFAYEKGGVYRVPLSGGQMQPVKGAERQRILQWPWVGAHRVENGFAELFNAETGERRDAVVAADEEVRCGVIRCAGVKVRYEKVKVTCTVKPCTDKVKQKRVILRSFVRNRDGSGERPLPDPTLYGPTDLALERFFKQILHGPRGESVMALYDVETGRMADLGLRPDAKGLISIPQSQLDALMTYSIGDKMYVLDLSTIE
ncbi:TolB family protein [Streptosporangium amethystogenes]|uniref:TolB family protein n=1 Tax=Streptosporangium amethystogenes TaxID=2002 RepID=UPI0004CB2363|nr:cell wall synthesis protein CwsA [Streptosporangium amethystogenes]